MLLLEGFQAGLSWITILRKRENFRKAFRGFDPEKIVRFGERDFERLVQDAGIVRNRLKIQGSVLNARAYLTAQKEFGSFDKFIWQFTGGKTLRKPGGLTREGIVPTTAGIRPHVQRAAAPRIQICGFHHLLRLHAGSGHGRRPRPRLLEI